MRDNIAESVQQVFDRSAAGPELALPIANQPSAPLGLVGGVAAALPLVVDAQETGRTYRIGVDNTYRWRDG